ncbi:MAG: MFS transporter [Conexivisphaerales archaeon]
MFNEITKNARYITFGRMITSVGFSATIPFLAIYLAVQRDAPLFLIGIMYLLQGLASLASQVIAGYVSDFWGPKRTLAAGYLFGLASSFYMAFLLVINASVSIIVFTYPLFSLLRGFSMPAQAALLAEEKTDSITNFSLLAMASNLGFAVGPALGGVLVSYTGYPFLFVFSGLTSLLTFLTTYKLNEATYHLQREKHSPVPDRNVIFFILICVLGYVVIGQDIQPFALYAGYFLGVSSLVVGYLFSFSGLLIVALQLPVMRLLRRFGSHNVILLSSVVAALSFILLFYTSNSIHLFVSMAVITLSEILFVVPSQIWITRAAPQTRKGSYQGYYSATATAGRSMASWLGSTLQGSSLGPRGSWIAMLILSALMFLLTWVHKNKKSAEG